MRKKEKTKRQIWVSVIRAIGILIWLAILVAIFLNRDKITLESIISYSPSNAGLAVVSLLLLFALKSLTMVLYCGIFYAASGILFPLWLAIPVSLAGTAIMATVPYVIGKWLGTREAERLSRKYPKLKMLNDFSTKNNFLFTLVIRMIGLLPMDPLSAYMGSIGMNYRNYVTATVLGMAPKAILFTIMGMSANNIKSPAFLIALGLEVLLAVVSFLVVRKKKNLSS